MIIIEIGAGESGMIAYSRSCGKFLCHAAAMEHPF